MAFDFAKAEKAALARKDSPKALGAIVLAPSSGGKSFLMGTLGVKTLYLFSGAEDHGPSSAILAGGSDVVDLQYDMDSGKTLGHDATMKNLLSILSDVEGIKAAGFKAVAVDGLTALEQIIRETSQFKVDCLSKEGKHNGFQEPAATLRQLTQAFDLLRKLRREAGMHYLVSCILDVKTQGDDGEITDSEPQLLGYKLPAVLLPQFPTQLVVGRMQNPEGKEEHRLQFNASVSKASVDNKTKELKKYTNFCPRIEGVSSDKLPPHMKADLKQVLKLQETGGKK